MRVDLGTPDEFLRSPSSSLFHIVAHLLCVGFDFSLVASLLYFSPSLLGFFISRRGVCKRWHPFPSWTRASEEACFFLVESACRTLSLFFLLSLGSGRVLLGEGCVDRFYCSAAGCIMKEIRRNWALHFWSDHAVDVVYAFMMRFMLIDAHLYRRCITCYWVGYSSMNV